MSNSTSTVQDNDHTLLLIKSHLDWTWKQGRILTAHGRATDYFSAQGGFPFDETELPHFRLLQDDTSFSDIIPENVLPIVGAWSRTYFVGGWEHSCDAQETVYNLQTNTLFIDLRIPHSRHVLLPKTATSLQEYSKEELRYYARQHVFCGASIVVRQEEEKSRRKGNVCTRHHCLDWNFVGIPRPRPNKWWIEFKPTSNDIWKEWAYATDMNGQHYYVEQWQRLDGDDGGDVTLALRKERLDETNGEDGILVVVGSHFNYIRGHALAASSENEYKDATSLVELVDAALEAGDRETAIAWLERIRAGHGRILDGKWEIDCAIEPWKEGTVLFDKGEVVVEGTDVGDCCVIWNGERWKVVDSTLQDIQQVKDLFENRLVL